MRLLQSTPFVHDTTMISPIVTRPTFEHHHNGLGLGRPDPRVSWKFEANHQTTRGWVQTAYEIEVKISDGESEVYKVDSDASVLVPWPARNLKSRESATVRVRAHGRSSEDNCEGWTDWSHYSVLEVALLEPEDFKASFITSAERIGPNGPLQPLCFRKEFTNPSSEKEARLYVTAMGVFHVYINGERVSDEEMAPGWQSYHSRLNYRTWKVSSLVAGTNEIRIEAAEGWYNGRLGFRGGKRFLYGKDIGVMAQLDIGDWQLCTDETWSCATFGTVSSELYDGESYDASKETAQQQPTRKLPWPPAKLIAAEAPPVRVTEVLPAVEIFKSNKGKTVVDFGQNLVGKLSVKNLPKSGTIVFKHAEVLEDGEICTRPLRLAKATDTLVLDGRTSSWTPKFTFHGFRYAQIEGWEPELADISALVMHTDMQRRGYFKCSNEMVNKFHRNVLWSMKGNFLSVPTDCPQRDERLGWTADLQVFSRTASFLYDTVGMLGEWLQDLAAEQKDGIVPFVVPDVHAPQWPHMPNCVWDDAAIITPDTLYDYSGDTEIVKRQFKSMKSWLDEGVTRDSSGLWNPDQWHAADWLDPTAPPNDPGLSTTDPVMVADAYLIRVTRVMSELCASIGETAEAERYANDADKFKKAFQHKYVTPAGILVSNTQTGLALAVQYDLLPDEFSARVAENLDYRVRRAGFRIATGFVGTPLICHALTKVGKPQLAYRMLLEKKCPSWMYPVTMGATTTWERWDSMMPDGRVNPGQMTSFNHYALGAVADWLHTTVGGISSMEPGWKKVKINPVPGGNLRWAETSFEGPYGTISCYWNLVSKLMEVTVPPNTTAVVVVQGKEITVGSGNHTFAMDPPSAPWPPEPIVPPHLVRPADEIAG